eukprot:scaffold3183_cov381-Prasinococcus_capsulatus_cf.AAC.11
MTRLVLREYFPAPKQFANDYTHGGQKYHNGAAQPYAADASHLHVKGGRLAWSTSGSFATHASAVCMAPYLLRRARQWKRNSFLALSYSTALPPSCA